MAIIRDYSLVRDRAGNTLGSDPREDDWFKPNVPREQLLGLMQRTNASASRDLVVWLSLLVLSGWWLVATWLSWWTVPAAIVYGVLYGSASDARWHECGHRTAFASRRANDIVYHFASFMVLREPVSWRWSHFRHHAETIIVGRDPEIAFPRPTSKLSLIAEFFGLLSARREFRKYSLSIIGRIPEDVETYLPDRERARSIRVARIHLATHIAVTVTCVLTQSLLPAMLVGLPSLYGRWLQFLLGVTQHAGLEEDVLDHRLNTRSVKMNFIIRFLYSNMNYHLEHHLFPAVPYHRLPELHELIREQLPDPVTSFGTALKVGLRDIRSIRNSFVM